MRKFRFARRTLCLFAIACATQLSTASPVRADMFGADLPILMGILTQAIATVSNLASMLSNLHQQLGALTTMLHTLDPSSYSKLAMLIESNGASFDELTRDVNSMGFTLGDVNSQFRKVYAASHRNTKFRDFDALYERWNQEILASTEIAARSQTILSTLQANAEQAQSILYRSKASDGQVAQLQATVQMLGVLSSQNNSLLQTLTTTSRVLTASAATTASEQQLSREKKRRHLEGYTDRGPAIVPMDKLP